MFKSNFFIPEAYGGAADLKAFAGSDSISSRIKKNPSELGWGFVRPLGLPLKNQQNLKWAWP